MTINLVILLGFGFGIEVDGLFSIFSVFGFVHILSLQIWRKNFSVEDAKVFSVYDYYS